MSLVAFKRLGTNEAMAKVIFHLCFFGRTQRVLQVPAEGLGIKTSAWIEKSSIFPRFHPV